MNAHRSHSRAGRPGRGGAEAGFTLLELLIATAVAAIVLLAIDSTYFGALKLYRKTNDELATDLVRQRTLDLIEHDVDGLMLPASVNSTPPAGTFSGQFQDTPTDSITQEFSDQRISPDFYTTSGTVDGWNPFSEVQAVAYFLAPTTDASHAKTLIRAVTRNLLPLQTPVTTEQILVPGVADAEFDYFDGNEWTTTWDSTATSTLPLAIRFSLTLAPSNPNDPPPQPIQLLLPVLVQTSTTASQAAQAMNGTGS
jgi:prepilin-type N-terminal cleavage/methylation domain-containing protein